MPNEFSYPIKVAYSQTDALGIVYHANYLEYLERARTEWLSSLGFPLSKLTSDLGIVFVVKDANISYHKPAYFEQELVVQSQVSSIKPASLVFDQKVFAKTCSNSMICQAKLKIVCCNKDFNPRPMPKALLTEIQEYGV